MKFYFALFPALSKQAAYDWFLIGDWISDSLGITSMQVLGIIAVYKFNLLLLKCVDIMSSCKYNIAADVKLE